MRRTAFLLLSLLSLCALAPAGARAQFDRELVYTTSFGGWFAPPGDLYVGNVTVEWPAEPVNRRIQTRYQERVSGQTGLTGGLRLTLDDHAFVGLRGHYGRGTSEASYTGGGTAGPETLGDRALSWYGADLLAGLTLGHSDAAAWTIFAGMGMARWLIETRGRGRDALADAAVPAPAEDLHWPDRSWRSTNGFAGTELRVHATNAFTVTLGADMRVLNANIGSFAKLDRQAFRPLGTPVTVQYQEHWQLLPTLRLGLNFRVGRKVLVDPGTRAMETLRARAEDPSLLAVAASALPEGVRAALARADTATAVRVLEEALAAEPANPAYMGELGILLAYNAPAGEKEFEQRLQAAALLRQALEGDPGNPRYLMALGALLEKQRMFNDSRRVLSRALGASADRPQDIGLDDIAEVYYQRGHALEQNVQDHEGLKGLGLRSPPVTHGDCGLISAFCLNYLSPKSFFNWFQELPDMGLLVRDKRTAMLGEYANALEISPAHAGANRALLAVHARAGDWQSFGAQAAEFAAARPDDPGALALHAAGLAWRGAQREAEPVFRDALARMSTEDRALFQDIRPLLDETEEEAWDSLDTQGREKFRALYWRGRDPLMITPFNEREIEHYARVAVAELLFPEPQMGKRGALTDRGEIFIRYGRPTTIWQIPRNDQLVANFGERTRQTGGRWIFWNYDPEHPSFIFERGVGRSSVRHVFGSMSLDYAQNAKSNRPTVFRNALRDAGPVTLQLARFRSLDGRRSDVELYARSPARSLTRTAQDTVHTGIFVFAGADTSAVASRTAAAPIRDGRIDLRATLPAGDFAYAVEVLSPDASASSASRGSFTIQPVGPGLALSDMLVASEVSAPSEHVAHHRELSYEPLRCLALPASRRVSLIFEVYGLATERGEARYAIALETGQNTLGNSIVRLWRGIRTESAGKLSFEREVEPIAGRVVEWFEVELPTSHADETFIRMVVTDRISGQTARSERLLSTDCGS